MVEPMPFTFVGNVAFPLRIFMIRPYVKLRRQRNQGQREKYEGNEMNEEEDYDRIIRSLGV